MPIQSLPGSRFRSRQAPGLHSLTTRPLTARPSRLRLVGLPVARQTGGTQTGWSVSGQRQTLGQGHEARSRAPSLPLRAAGQKTVGRCINNATKEAV